MSTGYLIGNWSHFYIVDENYRTLAKTELTGSVQDRVCKIRQMREGIPPPEIVKMVKEVKNLEFLAVEDRMLASNLKKTGVSTSFLEADTFRRLRLMFFRKGIHKRQPFALSTALQDKREADAQPDMVVHRLVDMLDIYTESIQFYENFRETWYKDFSDKGREVHPSLADELGIVKDTDGLLRILSDLRKKAREALASVLEGCASNLNTVAGSEVAARLIAEAGSLRQLSMLSAGSIQILGAREALFRSQHLGTNPPKFGIIFQHPLIQELPPHQRGKMARFLSCQIAIASRADYLTHRDISKDLKKKIETRFLHLRMRP